MGWFGNGWLISAPRWSPAIPVRITAWTGNCSAAQARRGPKTWKITRHSCGTDFAAASRQIIASTTWVSAAPKIYETPEASAHRSNPLPWPIRFRTGFAGNCAFDTIALRRRVRDECRLLSFLLPAAVAPIRVKRQIHLSKRVDLDDRRGQGTRVAQPCGTPAGGGDVFCQLPVHLSPHRQ